MPSVEVFHSDTAATAITSAAVPPILAAAEHAPTTDSVVSWLPYIASILGPVAVLIVSRLMGALAAAKRETAKQLKASALKRLGDGDPDNNAKAESDLALAAILEASANGLDGRKPKDD